MFITKKVTIYSDDAMLPETWWIEVDGEQVLGARGTSDRQDLVKLLEALQVEFTQVFLDSEP